MKALSPLFPKTVWNLIPFSSWRLKVLLLLYLLSSSAVTIAQTKLWDKSYGTYDVEYLTSMIATLDGGYLLGFKTNDYNWGDLINSSIIKIDGNGNKVWIQTFDGRVTASVATTDGGYLLGISSTDYIIVKIDGNGNTIWEKAFGGSGYDELLDLVTTMDGGYLLGGSSNSNISGDKSQSSKGATDYWIVKLNGSGNKVWDKTLGGNKSDDLTSLVATPDGTFIVGGYSDSGISGDKSQTTQGDYDYWVVKLDASGDKLWDKTLGGSERENLGDIVATPDGGYLLGGSSDSGISGNKSEDSRGGRDYWIIKLDVTGQKEWDKTIGGQDVDELHTIVAASDGGYLLGGSSRSGIGGDKSEASRWEPGSFDYWVLKVTASGMKVWDKTYGGGGIVEHENTFTYSRDELTEIIINADGSCLLGGTSVLWGEDRSEGGGGGYDVWIIKLDNITKKDQTISFNPINKALDDPPFALSATASSGLPVSFSIVSGPATINNNIITLTGLGKVVVKASQAGDSTYNTAPDVIKSFFVEMATPVTLLWDKTFGGTVTNIGTVGDQFKIGASSLQAMVATSDGGYLLGGYSDSSVGNDKSEDTKDNPISRFGGDYWVVKIDENGTKIWDKTFGSSGYEYLSSIVATPDGGYLLGGESDSDISDDKSESSRGGRDYWVVKIEANGNKVWDKTFGGTSHESLRAMIAMPDGGYLLGGESRSGVGGDKTEVSRDSSQLPWERGDYWVVKIDADGNKVWDKTFGGGGIEGLGSMIATPDGGYLLGGGSSSGIDGDKSEANRGEDSDYWIIKIDAEGNKAWDKTLGGGKSDHLLTLINTKDGSYLLGGWSQSGISGDKTENIKDNYIPDNSVGGDYWVVKIDISGNKLWDRTFGGDRRDILRDMITTPDGGYLLGGWSNSGISDDKTENIRDIFIEYNPDIVYGYFIGDYWLVKIDIGGNKLWSKTLGGNGWDHLTDIVATPDGGYLLGGESRSGIGFEKTEASRGTSDFWIVKIKEEEVPPPVSSWDQGYGGSSFEYLQAVVKTADGGYLLGGHSLSRHNGDKSQDTRSRYDFWLVKTDALGAKLWDKSYGGSDDDYLNWIVPTADGGYLLAGSSQSGMGGEKSQASRGSQDFWIVKISSDGTKQWDQTYGGSGFEDLEKALQLPSGEYVLAGVSDSPVSGEKSQNRRGSRDYWLVKVSATGVKLWDKRYGGSKAEELGSFMRTAGGGFVLGGSSLSSQSGDKSNESKGGKDYWLVQTDSYGNQLWDKSYGGSGEEQLTAMGRTTAGELLLAGHSNSGVSGDKSQASRGSNDYWLLKLDTQGTKLWDKTYGGSGAEELKAVLWTQDGGFLLGGSSFSNQGGEKSQNSKGSSDYWVIKLDEQGEQEWDQAYGGAGEDRLRYLLQTEDEGYLLGGFSFSDQGGDKSQHRQGRSDYWLVKIPPTPASTTSQIRIAQQVEAPVATTTMFPEKPIAFPNPFLGGVTFGFSLKHGQPVSISIYSSTGQLVRQIYARKLVAGIHQIQWDGQDNQGRTVAPGIYFYQMQVNGQLSTGKLLKADSFR